MNDLDLKHAFDELASEAAPRPAAWAPVERRIRRRHFLSLAGAVMVSATVGLGVIALADRIGGVRNDGFTGPPATGSPSAFRDEQNNFQITIPPGWTISGFEEGVQEIFIEPPGESSFSIELFTQVGRHHADHTGFGEQPFESFPDVDGASAVRWEETLLQSSGLRRRVAYRLDWTGRRAGWADPTCSAAEPCDPSVATLHFLVTAETDELWRRYGPDAEGIVRSAVTLDDVRPDRWLDTVVHTPWGRVEPGVLYDARTEVLVAFLDGRAAGTDVSRVYPEAFAPPITRYRVLSRVDRSADSVLFMVEVRRKDSATEWLVVGPDGKVGLLGSATASSPAPEPTIAPVIPNDARTQLLVKFLEARVAGSGAEGYLASGAAHIGTERLYAYGDYDMIGYRITERHDGAASTDGNPYFIVVAVYEDGVENQWNGTVPENQEFIIVGPVDGELKITRWADEGTS